MNKTTILCILDGWGCSEIQEHNAIFKANTPFYDELVKNNSVSQIGTSGLDVGLPDGQMGNSEVGHMNIGSGRIIMQNFPRINKAIETGQLKENKDLNNLIKKLKENGKRCHIMGLMSPGGVHSHQNHTLYIGNYIAQSDIEVNIHAFLDGRDVPPKSAIEYINNFTNNADKNIKISTLSGRYYAMDRDQRWDRTKLSYDAMVHTKADRFSNIEDAINNHYKNKDSDEFLIPVISDEYMGIEDGDAIISVNFRSDRIRQILYALTDDNFSGFDRGKKINFSNVISITEAASDLNQYMDILFPTQKFNNILGEVIANNNKKQLRIAETEKYAHVTFFFNSGREKEFENEDRILIPSPNVATYDLDPKMSAFEVTDKLIQAVKDNKYDLVVVNFANPDMVGHTGVEKAAIEAVETIDACLNKLVSFVKEIDANILITADHGNIETMVDENGKPHTSHTTNPVPLIFVSNNNKYKLSDGRLCDLAPTILQLLNIDQPEEMTGKSLLS